MCQLVIICQNFFMMMSSSVHGTIVSESGSTEFKSIIGADLKGMADKTIQKAKENCSSKSVKDVITEVLEGDARNVVCEAAEKYGAAIPVLGCHNYGAVKRVVVGSVSDYGVQHAPCTVMVVKRPKITHSSSSSFSNLVQ